MKLRYLPYYFFIILFSCKEPTLIGDKDCAGVIGGKAIVDDCGYCAGGTTKLQFNYFWGCDGECIGSQFDCTYPGDSTCTSNDPPGTCVSACNGDYITDCKDDCIHKDDAREFDLCGVCDPCDDGTKGDYCNVWNSSCAGCTDPLATCNSFNSTATIYKEGDCEIPNFYCEIDTETNLLDIETIVSDTCDLIGVRNDCGPGKDICDILDCSDSDLDSSFTIPCNPVLMKYNNPTEFLADSSNIGNGECDYYGVQDSTIRNILSCPEFGYDGGTPEANFTDGDCNLVDCRGYIFQMICVKKHLLQPILIP